MVDTTIRYLTQQRNLQILTFITEIDKHMLFLKENENFVFIL